MWGSLTTYEILLCFYDYVIHTTLVPHMDCQQTTDIKDTSKEWHCFVKFSYTIKISMYNCHSRGLLVDYLSMLVPGLTNTDYKKLTFATLHTPPSPTPTPKPNPLLLLLLRGKAESETLLDQLAFLAC